MPAAISSLDDARREHPDLAFSLYALTPGGAITLEIVTPDEEIFTFTATTEAAAFAVAFPPEKGAPVVSDMAIDIFE